MMMASKSVSMRRTMLVLQRQTASMRLAASLSSAAHRLQTDLDTNLVQKPANLTIDPSSTCSPFRGMKRVQHPSKISETTETNTEVLVEEDDDDDDDEVKETAETAKAGDAEKGEVSNEAENANTEAPAAAAPEAASEAAPTDGDVDDGVDEFYVDEDEEGLEMWFDPSTKPEPYRVVPLPERLTVSVLDKEDLTNVVGTISLDRVVFGQEHVRVDIIKRVVQYQRNKKRGKRFPAITKTISQVSGSGRKVRPQKGQGAARMGHKRPPHFRGGAKAHGPKGVAQDYTTKLNKHVRKLGLVHALSQKLKEGNVILVNDWRVESYRTNNLSKVLGSIGIGGKQGASAYLLDWIDDADSDEGVHNHLCLQMVVAAGNIPKIKVSTQMAANVYDILKHEKLVLTLGAVEGLETRLGGVTY